MDTHGEQVSENIEQTLIAQYPQNENWSHPWIWPFSIIYNHYLQQLV